MLTPSQVQRIIAGAAMVQPGERLPPLERGNPPKPIVKEWRRRPFLSNTK